MRDPLKDAAELCDVFASVNEDGGMIYGIDTLARYPVAVRAVAAKLREKFPDAYQKEPTPGEKIAAAQVRPV